MTAWDYDDKGELVCVGYGMPKDGLASTADDRRMAYLCASQGIVAGDTEAAALLNQYLGNAEVEQGMEVFVFNEAGVPNKPKPPNRVKKSVQAGKMARKVNLMNQRVGSKHKWPRAATQKKSPLVPEVPRQVLMQEQIYGPSEEAETYNEFPAVAETATAAGDVSTAAPVTTESSFLGKKYKPVADKVKPILGELDAKFRIERKITGDPLANMPVLDPNPPDFVPTGRFTAERREAFREVHNIGFVGPEELKFAEYFMMRHEGHFAWDET